MDAESFPRVFSMHSHAELVSGQPVEFDFYNPRKTATVRRATPMDFLCDSALESLVG